MKRYLLKYFALFLALVTISSCTEKELIMPEVQSQDNLISLGTRPSLRPDSVKVYPSFYQTVEVVYPQIQPERAVKSTISYLDIAGGLQTIEVTDFDEVITIDDISAGETMYTIVYYNQQDIASAPVTHRVTPFRALTDYVYESIGGYGEFGNAYIVWENITTKEVQIEVKYEDQGEEKTVSKLSAALRDTIIVPHLVNVDYQFDVQVKDLEKPYASDIEQLTINPGLSVQDYALSTLTMDPGFGRVFLTWENPTETSLLLHLSYEVDGQAKSAEYTSTAVEGAYTLTNLPEGTTQLTATFTNTTTESVSIVRILEVIADKGVKEAVMDALSVHSYGNNYAVVRGQNPSSIPIEMTVSYNKKSGGVYEETVQLEPKTLTYSRALEDVKDDAVIQVIVTDDIGAATKNFNSTVKDEALTGVELDRIGWTALASSQRDANQSASTVLDGLFGSGTTGWVSQWGNGSIDLTGTPSNAFPHFIQLDMKEITYVTGFRTINHSNGVQNGAQVFILQYSIDGENFIDAQIYDRGATKTAANASLSYTLDVPILARYIRYYAVSSDSGANGTIRMAEFYVSGVQ